jgi:hypothetical protein
MHTNLLVPNRSGYVSKVIYDLTCCGWRIDSLPDGGKIPRNRLRLILKFNGQELKLRILAYKVTTSGRSRSHERRIEITTTYQSGLNRLRGFRDVVLGVDLHTGKYVGVDSRRLNIGGPTHNASSFFDLEGLSVMPGEMLINPRPVASPVFPEGIEQHAFFDPRRLSEYLINQQEIHSGRYAFQGSFSGRLPLKRVAWPNTKNVYRATGDAFVLRSGIKTRRSVSRITPRLIASVEEKDFTKLAGRKLTPAQLKQLLSICDEIGALGEQVVLGTERKRLRRRGLNAQAKRVERVSLWSVGEGYDILSFEDNGVTKRYLEVKTTTGKGTLVDISTTEWKAAQRFREHYYLVRVINVKRSPKIFYIRNPIELEKRGRVVRTASGWRVDLRSVMNASN